MWSKPKRSKANWTKVPGAQVSRKTERKTRVRPRSPKMEGRMRAYWKLAAEYLKANRKCQCPGCWNRSRDIHHARGRVGSLLTDWRHWLALCRPCHNWVAEHPEAARLAGFLCAVGEWNVPDPTPVPQFRP